MVRIIIIILILVFFNSCIRLNEYGYYRTSMSKYTIKPNTNEDVYTIIDTNSVYVLNKEELTNVSGSTIPQFYKFYSNGRVGNFYINDVNLKKDTILEAKKGYMGYYYFNEKNIIIQFYNNNWQGSGLETDSLYIQKDTMIITKKIYKPYAEIKSIFIKEKIPNNIRITKPDW